MTTTLPSASGAAAVRQPRTRVRSLIRAIPLAPAIILMLVFLLGPIVWALYGSLTNTALSGPNAANPQFVGLDNYRQLFTSPTFPLSVVLTLIFVVASAVVGQNGLGLGAALLLRRASKPVRLIVGLVFVGAWVLPEVVAAFAAYAFFHNTGTLNALLAGIGITGPNWLYTYPMVAVILANIWRGSTFSMLVYSAALNEIPDEIKESASIDGAGGFAMFRLITLPMIRRAMAANLLLTTLLTMSVFALIYIMTAGGPGFDSTTLPLLAYQEAFKFSRVGYGTTVAVVLLAIGAVFSVIYVRLLKPEVDI
ncbi:sugar ABC transporter permease [Herbiconiux moechotypicola]|uniref:Sugar ABC transporter permease n=1 Tax=Herbiconiux moechotypicola TaxID=637393 RepID=A0ABN3E2R2_9MICO